MKVCLGACKHICHPLEAAGELTGAKPPEGIEASMALTNPNDLKVPETRMNHRIFCQSE